MRIYDGSHSGGIEVFGISNLHTGHVLFVSNHGLRQSGWYIWPQGMNMPFLPIGIYSTHTVHVGGSNAFDLEVLALTPPGAIYYF